MIKSNISSAYSFRYHFTPPLSPTTANITYHLQKKHARATSLVLLSKFNDQHLAFDPDTINQLEYKHLLAQLSAVHCPNIIPDTYCIHDYNWPNILGEINEKYYQNQYKQANELLQPIWILKPSLMNNGQHIHIFTSLTELETHFLCSRRIGGWHVLQQYISNPHLLDRHKYSIRMFVVLTNYAGVFIFPHGYFNLSRYIYHPSSFDNLKPHLTNEHLDHHEANVFQIPTHFFGFFKNHYAQIKESIYQIMRGLMLNHTECFIKNKKRKLAIVGFDFMIDASQQLWLLEANHGPCFPIERSHPLQKTLYDEFWQSFIHSFVIPIAKKEKICHIHYDLFEPLIPPPSGGAHS